MHLSMFSPREGGGRDTALGNLTDDFGTGVGPYIFQRENLKEIMSEFEGMPRGFSTQIVSYG